MYADTMPGEIAAWVQAEQAKCAEATEEPWDAEQIGVALRYWKKNGYFDEADLSKWMPDERDRYFIASARAAYPVLLDYATGLLDAHRVADVMDDACGTESTRDIRDTLRSQIAALHAALVAQGLIGGKG